MVFELKTKLMSAFYLDGMINEELILGHASSSNREKTFFSEDRKDATCLSFQETQPFVFVYLGRYKSAVLFPVHLSIHNKSVLMRETHGNCFGNCSKLIWKLRGRAESLRRL